MSIVCTVPAPNCLFQARRASFKKYISPLKTLTRTVSAVLRAVEPVHGTESTRKHLSNLDKLLPKQQPQIDTAVLRPIANNGSLENKGTPGIWETLNFERIWPEMKAAEEISPRNLNRLQRLLSMSPKYSPRNNLGSRWREYHGCNDWDGLLDPLDENLRREVVRYGEFIQAAYHCFHSDPATSPDEAQYIRHVALPDRSYKVTKSLYATSSIGLPKWVDDVAPDLEWMTQRTSWMGYVAVCDDPREIARMGRRDIVITLRGTATCLEWAENLRDLLVQLSGQNDPIQGNPKVQCGFQSLFRTPGALAPCLAESVVEEIRRLMDLYKGENLSITVTGHSLGAALALLVADELSSSTLGVPPIAVFTFGGPRVGNRSFANRINSKNVKVLRIVNSQDLITRVPGMFVSEGLDQTLRNSSVVPVLDVLDNNMPWAYSHVGRELRVDTKMSPFLKPDADMACCHDLEAYLHLVDGFISSKCAFRANAKRSLVKLLHEQTPNVKKLYTSKVKALSLNIDHSRERLSMTGCLPSPSS